LNGKLSTGFPRSLQRRVDAGMTNLEVSGGLQAQLFI